MRVRYHKPLAVNILPQEYRRRSISLLELALLVVLLGAVVASIPYLQDLRATLDEKAELQAEVRRLEAAASAVKSQEAKAEGLRQEVASLQATLDKTGGIVDAFGGERLNWDALLSSSFVSLPKGVQLSSVTKQSRELNIEGSSARGFEALREYYSQVSAIRGVSRVTITKTELKEAGGKGDILNFSLTVRLARD